MGTPRGYTERKPGKRSVPQSPPGPPTQGTQSMGRHSSAAEPTAMRLQPKAFYGFVGKFAGRVAEQTGIDPVATLLQTAAVLGPLFSSGTFNQHGYRTYHPKLSVITVPRYPDIHHDDCFAPIRALIAAAKKSGLAAPIFSPLREGARPRATSPGAPP